MPGSRTKAPRCGEECAKQVESRANGSSKKLRIAGPREWQTDQPEGEPRCRNHQQRRRAMRRRPCNAREQEEEAEQ
jgi:hypothetical protein